MDSARNGAAMGEQSGPVLAREELPPRLTIDGEVISIPAMLLEIAMQVEATATRQAVEDKSAMLLARSVR